MIVFDVSSMLLWRWHIYVQFQFNEFNYIWRSVSSSATTTNFSPEKPGGEKGNVTSHGCITSLTPIFTNCASDFAIMYEFAIYKSLSVLINLLIKYK